jgi:pimeloyl-ACP methyl ester carboxylesterase
LITYPASAGGIRSRVLASGREARTIVMIHGLSSRADRWTLNIDALATAGWRALAPDLPGHGFAEKGRGFDYSAAGYCAFLEALLDAEGAEDLVLVGTSFGGLVASALALRQGRRVRGLVLLGTIGLMPIGQERRQRTIDWLPRMDRGSIRDRLRRSVFDASSIGDEFVEEEFRINTSPGAAESFAALASYYANGIEDDITCDRLAALDGSLPILLIWGSHDASVAPAIGEAAHAKLPGSEFVVVPEAAHLPYRERPSLVNRLLIDFVTKVS